MKTRISSYNKAMRAFVDRVCNHPSDTLIDLYEHGGNKIFKGFTFELMIPVAMEICSRYQQLGRSVGKSRELELVLYHLHQNGYSTHELLIISSIASHSSIESAVVQKLLSSLTNALQVIIEAHGDLVLQPVNSPHPQLQAPQTNYRNN